MQGRASGFDQCMGTACVGCGKSGRLYQAYVMLEIRFSITKDNISKIRMSLCIVENNMNEERQSVIYRCQS